MPVEHTAIANDFNLSRRAVPLIDRRKLFRRGDGVAVDGENDIAGLQPQLPCDAAGGHLVHLHASTRACAESATDFLVLHSTLCGAGGRVAARCCRAQHTSPTRGSR